MTPALLALCLLTELEHDIPPLLLVSVVQAETRGRSVVARGRGKGRLGCDVGVAQVHVPRCVKSEVRRLLNPASNLAAGARILRWSRVRCSARPWWYGCHGWLYGRYNPGSIRWTRTVRRYWRLWRAAARSRTDA